MPASGMSEIRFLTSPIPIKRTEWDFQATPELFNLSPKIPFRFAQWKFPLNEWSGPVVNIN
jgi:hypothetical protein